MARQQGLAECEMKEKAKTLIITDIAYQYVDLKEASASRYEYYATKHTALDTFIGRDSFGMEMFRKDIPLIRIRNAGHVETKWGMYPEVAEILGEPLQCIEDQGKEIDRLDKRYNALNLIHYKTEEELAAIKNTVTHATFLQRLRYLFTGKLI